jgi:hypothetical protein
MISARAVRPHNDDSEVEESRIGSIQWLHFALFINRFGYRRFASQRSERRRLGVIGLFLQYGLTAPVSPTRGGHRPTAPT